MIAEYVLVIGGVGKTSPPEEINLGVPYMYEEVEQTQINFPCHADSIKSGFTVADQTNVACDGTFTTFKYDDTGNMARFIRWQDLPKWSRSEDADEQGLEDAPEVTGTSNPEFRFLLDLIANDLFIDGATHLRFERRRISRHRKATWLFIDEATHLRFEWIQSEPKVVPLFAEERRVDLVFNSWPVPICLKIRQPELRPRWLISPASWTVLLVNVILPRPLVLADGERRTRRCHAFSATHLLQVVFRFSSFKSSTPGRPFADVSGERSNYAGRRCVSPVSSRVTPERIYRKPQTCGSPTGVNLAALSLSL